MIEADAGCRIWLTHCCIDSVSGGGGVGGWMLYFPYFRLLVTVASDDGAAIARDDSG